MVLRITFYNFIGLHINRESLSLYITITQTAKAQRHKNRQQVIQRGHKVPVPAFNRGIKKKNREAVISFYAKGITTKD